MSLLEMQAKREDNGKELRCDASNPAVEGIMADSTTITIECKLHLSPVAVSLCAPPTKQKKKAGACACSCRPFVVLPGNRNCPFYVFISLFLTTSNVRENRPVSCCKHVCCVGRSSRSLLLALLNFFIK